MSEVIEQVLRLGFMQVLPVALAAGGAALLVGWLAFRFGVQDPVPVLVARAAAALAMVSAGASAWFAETAAWTGELWARIAEVGRGMPPP